MALPFLFIRLFYCNKTHGFFHQNIMCSKDISGKDAKCGLLMVSTEFLNCTISYMNSFTQTCDQKYHRNHTF